ncbi:MAG TPA: GTP-binding protein, partial [Firmicutes bacterium]|nr:GTP-binding protein [Bacillota bacterium]
MRRIVLVGSPNVGKSGIFNQLTGRYAVVSNYPGTTVEISRGEMMLEGELVEVVDTPGTYSLLPASEEEAVTRRLLWQEDADLVLHVVDTKNLEHSLSLTFALLEAGFRVILVLNMFDEAERFGFAVDVERLEERLGIPCAATIGTSGWGVEGLKEAVRKELAVLHAEESAVGGGFAFPVQTGGKRRGRKLVKYPLQIERLLTAATGSMKGQYPFSARTAALLLLVGDEEVASWLHPRDRRSVENISKGIPPDQVILSVAAARRKAAQRLLEGIVRKPEAAGAGS